MDINLDDLWKNTVKQLRDFARENKINLRGKYLKADIIETIREYLKGLEDVVTDEPESALEILPPELLKEVVLRLSVSGMVTVCSANKVISNLCEPLWKDKYRELYGKQVPMLDSGLGWKENLLRLGVYGFGRNNRGHLGLGDKINKNSPQRIPDKWFQSNNRTIKIIQVSAGLNYTVCLDENGNLWTFGFNEFGQLGLGHKGGKKLTPQRIPDESLPVRITQVSAGSAYTVCLDENGNVWGFGLNEVGQLGLMDTIEEIVYTPQRIDPDKFCVDQRKVKIIQVSAGGIAHTVCLDENGNVWGFGSNDKGQLGLGYQSTIQYIPQRIDPDKFRVDQRTVKIIQVSAGGDRTVCLDNDGNVWTFGWNRFGELGVRPDIEKIVNTPRMIDSNHFRVEQRIVKIIQVSVGEFHTVCLGENGNVWTFGSNEYGELGLGYQSTIQYIPQRIDPDKFRVDQRTVKITQISTGEDHTVCLDENGNVWTFGSNEYSQLGLGKYQRQYLTPQLIGNIKAIQISTNWDHTMLIGL